MDYWYLPSFSKYNLCCEIFISIVLMDCRLQHVDLLQSEQLFAVSMASPGFNAHLCSAVFDLTTRHLPSTLPSSANLAILSLFIHQTWPS